MKRTLVFCLAVFFPIFINAINNTANVNDTEVIETTEDIIKTRTDEITLDIEEQVVTDVSTTDDLTDAETVIIPIVTEISSKEPDNVITDKVTVITDESKVVEISTSGQPTPVAQKETSEITVEIPSRRPDEIVTDKVIVITGDSTEVEISMSGKETSGTTSTQTTAKTTTRKPDPCDSNPCQNGGTCTSSGKRVKCECQKGTWGRHCEKVDWCKILQDDGTTGTSYCNGGEAKCISNSKYKNFTCACYNRRKEFDYNTGKCAAIDMCSPNPCENGGVCENSGYQAHCDCPEGTSGRRCEKVNWCKIKMENGISGNDFCNKGEARCLEDRKNKNFTCSCYNRKDIFNEVLQKCVKRNQFFCTKFKEGYVDCLLRKASCTDDYNSEKGYTCECLDGYHFDENGSCVENRNETEAKAFPVSDLTLCDRDTTGFDECADRNALCYYNNLSYLGYDCVCEEGMQEENGVCVGKN